MSPRSSPVPKPRSAMNASGGFFTTNTGGGGGESEDAWSDRKQSLSSIDAKLRALSTESLNSSGCPTDDEDWDDKSKDEEKLERQELEIAKQYRRLSSASNSRVDNGGSLFSAWNHRYAAFFGLYIFSFFNSL